MDDGGASRRGRADARAFVVGRTEAWQPRQHCGTRHARTWAFLALVQPFRTVAASSMTIALVRPRPYSVRVQDGEYSLVVGNQRLKGKLEKLQRPLTLLHKQVLVVNVPIARVHVSLGSMFHPTAGDGRLHDNRGTGWRRVMLRLRWCVVGTFDS